MHPSDSRHDHWGRIRAMNRSQWAVVVSAPMVLALNAWRLRRHGYRAALDRMPSRTAHGGPPERQLRLAEEIAYAVWLACRAGPWRPRCLLRSLTLAWYLSRRGIPFRLRIGVAEPLAGDGGRADATLNAHAWVEHAGVVLNDRPDVAQRYRAFDSGAGAV